MSLADDLPCVVDHVGKLEQVLVNLIDNARDAPANGPPLDGGSGNRGRCLLRNPAAGGGDGCLAGFTDALRI